MGLGSVILNIGANTSAFISGVKGAAASFEQFNAKIKMAGIGLSILGAQAALVGKALTDVFMGVSKEGAEFEQAMANAGAVMNDFFTATVETSEGSQVAFEALTEKALELGETTRFTATEVADAMRFMGLAGLDAQQTFSGVKDTLDLAAAGNLDLARASDIATDTMKVFGIQADNLNRITDTMAATQANANTTVEQLAQAIKHAGPIASNLGISLEEVANVAGILADRMIKGTLAGTAINRALTTLSANTEKTTKILAKYGLEFEQVNVETRGFIDVLDELRDAGISPGDINRLFGVRAGKAINALVRTSKADFESLGDAIANSFGQGALIAAQRMDTLQGDVLQLRAAINSLNIQIFESLKELLRSLVQALTSVVRGFSEFASNNQNAARAVMIAVGALGALLVVLGTTTVALGLFGFALVPIMELANAGFFARMAKGIATVATSAASSAASLTSLNVVAAVTNGRFSTMAAAIKAALIQMRLLGVQALRNTKLLGASFASTYIQAFKGNMTGANVAAGKFFTTLGSMTGVNKGISLITKNIGKLGGALRLLGKATGVLILIDVFIELGKGATAAADHIMGAGRAIARIFEPLIAIFAGVSKGYETMSSISTKFFDMDTSSAGPGFWKSISSAVMALVDAFSPLIDALSAVLGLIGAVIGGIIGFATGAIVKGIEAIAMAIDFVASGFSDLKDLVMEGVGLADSFEEMGEAAKQAYDAMIGGVKEFNEAQADTIGQISKRLKEEQELNDLLARRDNLTLKEKNRMVELLEKRLEEGDVIGQQTAKIQDQKNQSEAMLATVDQQIAKENEILDKARRKNTLNSKTATAAQDRLLGLEKERSALQASIRVYDEQLDRAEALKDQTAKMVEELENVGMSEQKILEFMKKQAELQAARNKAVAEQEEIEESISAIHEKNTDKIKEMADERLSAAARELQSIADVANARQEGFLQEMQHQQDLVQNIRDRMALEEEALKNLPKLDDGTFVNPEAAEKLKKIIADYEAAIEAAETRIDDLRQAFADAHERRLEQIRDKAKEIAQDIEDFNSEMEDRAAEREIKAQERTVEMFKRQMEDESLTEAQRLEARENYLREKAKLDDMEMKQEEKRNDKRRKDDIKTSEDIRDRQKANSKAELDAKKKAAKDAIDLINEERRIKLKNVKDPEEIARINAEYDAKVDAQQQANDEMLANEEAAHQNRMNLADQQHQDRIGDIEEDNAAENAAFRDGLNQQNADEQAAFDQRQADQDRRDREKAEKDAKAKAKERERHRKHQEQLAKASTAAQATDTAVESVAKQIRSVGQLLQLYQAIRFIRAQQERDAMEMLKKRRKKENQIKILEEKLANASTEKERERIRKRLEAAREELGVVSAIEQKRNAEAGIAIDPLINDPDGAIANAQAKLDAFTAQVNETLQGIEERLAAVFTGVDVIFSDDLAAKFEEIAVFIEDMAENRLAPALGRLGERWAEGLNIGLAAFRAALEQYFVALTDFEARSLAVGNNVGQIFDNLASRMEGAARRMEVAAQRSAAAVTQISQASAGIATA